MTDAHALNRRPLIAANWKMNKTIAETEAFIRDFIPNVPRDVACDVVLCPPFTALSRAADLLKNSAVALGGQNMNDNVSGAYTGEVSPVMLTDAGCRYVVIGHSERRQYYGETDALVNKKIILAFRHQLIPIACVGETLAEREADKTFSVIDRQVRAALQGLPSSETQRLVFAYEPVWAIGTGKTATPSQAEEVHLFIRNILKDMYGSQTSLSVRIVYGGSVKPDNMGELMSCANVDGGLVGGASLDAVSFLKIVMYPVAGAPGR